MKWLQKCFEAPRTTPRDVGEEVSRSWEEDNTEVEGLWWSEIEVEGLGWSEIELEGVEGFRVAREEAWKSWRAQRG